MPINTQWGNAQHTYIVVIFKNEWTWNELHRLEDEQLSGMLEQSQGAPLLMDMRASVWMRPPDLQREVMRSGQFHSGFNISTVVFTLMDSAIGTLLVQMHSRYAHQNTRYIHAQNINDAQRLLNSGLAHQFN